MIDARRVVSLVFLTCVFGCGSDPVEPDPGVNPNAIALDRRYELSSCNPAECFDYHPHGNGRVDSVRLILRPDRTADFTYIASGTSNPCYLTGAPCPTPYRTVLHLSGPYVFETTVNHGLYIQYGTVDRVYFSGNVPASVPSTWTGPDSLSYGCFSFCGGFKYTITPR